MNEKGEKRIKIKLHEDQETKEFIFYGWEKRDGKFFFIGASLDGEHVSILDRDIESINGIPYISKPQKIQNKKECRIEEYSIEGVPLDNVAFVQIEGSEFEWPVLKLSGHVSFIDYSLKMTLPKAYWHLHPKQFIAKVILTTGLSVIVCYKNREKVKVTSEMVVRVVS